MDVIPESPTKIPGTRLEMSSDSNLDIQISEKNFFLQLLKDNLLLVVTLTGVVCGAVVGLILRNFDLTEDSILLISYPGEIFMRILKLIILPLIVSSLISCTASLNAKLNGKIAVKTLTYFLLTSLFNACLGIALAVALHPGSQDAKTVVSSVSESRVVNVLDNFLDIGRNMFPDNIFQAFFQQTHTVHVPVKETERNGTLLNGTESVVPVKMTRTLRPRLTPIGICSVICGKILSVDDLGIVVAQLGWFVFTVVLGLVLYQVIALQLLYFIIIRRNPFTFYWDLAPAMLTAFATASTAAALPVTFQCMDEKLKIDQRISRFVLPIGCSINMDGTALFLSSATIFISQLNSMTLSASDLITVGLVSTAASMSSASVPSAALVLMLMILTSIGCPVEDVSLLFAVDWLVDRCRTVNNMLGDCYASAVVEHYSKDELMASERLPLHQTAKDVRSEKKVFQNNGPVGLDMPKGVSNGTFCN
ncbi:hypothetical protein RUM43_009868 [Polyplax serrata]|uniref:Amino acid transporter n=1 Tax=Polyplax serrata TaxID=468196 RepID=A0AAN8PKK7_POLSC